MDELGLVVRKTTVPSTWRIAVHVEKRRVPDVASSPCRSLAVLRPIWSNPVEEFPQQERGNICLIIEEVCMLYFDRRGIVKLKIYRLLVQVLICALLLISLVGGPNLALSASPSVEIVFPTWTRFEPTADTWTIPVGLMTTEQIEAKADLKAMRVNGKSIPQSIEALSEVIPVNVIEGVSQAELQRWNQLKRLQGEQALNVSEMTQLSKLDRAINGNKNVKGIDIKVKTDKLPFKVEDGKTYTLECDVNMNGEISTITTEVAITSIQTDSLWKPAELHVHSVASDGERTIADLRNIYSSKGYNVLYLTDHVDLIPNYSSGGEPVGVRTPTMPVFLPRRQLACTQALRLPL
jgi:hypothetical protein